jgi:hypothetical protein
MSEKSIGYLIDFLADLQSLDLNVLSSQGKFVIADYGIKINY